MTPFNRRTRAGTIRPKSGGKIRGARVQGRGAAQTLAAVTVPLWEDTWYRDTVEELLDADPRAVQRAEDLTRQKAEWRFTPAPERRTFLHNCRDPHSGEMMPYHDTVSPPNLRDDPELYREERAERLSRAVRKSPAAFCRRCRMWIDQDEGETF